MKPDLRHSEQSTRLFWIHSSLSSPRLLTEINEVWSHSAAIKMECSVKDLSLIHNVSPQLSVSHDYKASQSLDLLYTRFSMSDDRRAQILFRCYQICFYLI